MAVYEGRFEEEEYSSQFNGGTVARILAQLQPHWKWALGFVIAVGATSMLDATFTFLSKLIIDEGIIAQDPQRLRELIVIYGSLIGLQALSIGVFVYLTGVLGQKVQYDLRKKQFEHVQKLSLAYYNRTPLGWIMSRITSDSERMAELVTWGMLDLTWAGLAVITSLFFMLTINWQLALIVALILPMLVVAGLWFQRRILQEYRQSRKFNSKITGAYNENITGARVTKAMTRENANLDEFRELTEGMYRSSYRAAWYSALFLPTVQLISAFAVGGVVLFGGLGTQVGGMTIGGIQAFVTYITFMMWPIQDMARVYAGLQQAIASAERSFSLLDEEPDIINQPDAQHVDSVAGDIVFENVSFWYEEGQPVLQDFDLHVKQGESIALVGATGSGKSTIINLICRFYEPRAGRVLIQGRDYREFTLEALQSRLGIVLQTPHLFSGTILENIRYGRLNASDEEVIEAAKRAGAHDFILRYEKGYQEEVGEGGILLSVGQKQLLSIARAILAEPDIFIMDEATSSVDTLTEALIQQGMETLMQGRTSFIIAHRLSTIRNANRIIVIDKGRIIEAGTHAELIRLRGHYYKLYTRQFRQEAASSAGYGDLIA